MLTASCGSPSQVTPAALLRAGVGPVGRHGGASTAKARPKRVTFGKTAERQMEGEEDGDRDECASGVFLPPEKPVGSLPQGFCPDQGGEVSPAWGSRADDSWEHGGAPTCGCEERDGDPTEETRHRSPTLLSPNTILYFKHMKSWKNFREQLYPHQLSPSMLYCPHFIIHPCVFPSLQLPILFFVYFKGSCRCQDTPPPDTLHACH